MTEFQISEVRCVQYEFNLAIRSPQQTVWIGLTQRIDDWWLDDFRMLGAESCVRLETHAVGRLFESHRDAELLWYTVLSVNPMECLNLVGYCTAEFGGPSTSLLTLRLSPGETETILTIQDSLTGHVKDGHAESLRRGWVQLFSDGLKAWCEASQNVEQPDRTVQI